MYAVLTILLKKKAAEVAAAFEKMAVPYGKVRRDGRLFIVPAKDLVQGDCVLLEAGDLIPADIRLVNAKELRVRESFLTNKPNETSKDTEKDNQVFLSGLVTHGRGEGIVEQIGSDTWLGHAAAALVKEGLAKGVFKKMAALRRLEAAKKTIAQRSETPFSTELKVTAVAAPFTAVSPADYARRPNALLLLTAMVLCNDGESADFADSLVFLGEPCETALLNFAAPLGYEKERMERTMRRVETIPLDSSRCMTTVHKDGKGFRSFTRGETEAVLHACTHISDGATRLITEEDAGRIWETAVEMRRGAKQVLAFAMGGESAAEGFVFLGLASLDKALNAK